MSSAAGDKLMVLEKISKAYPGVQALKDVSLSVRRGEIHAIVGQNGAGKSTLVKILSGATLPDAGVIKVDGDVVRFGKPADAQAAGIQTIYQELSLVPQLSVAENIYLGEVPRRKGLFVAWSEMRRQADQMLRRIGYEIDVTQPVARYSVAEQQAVELAKALHKKCRVVLLDEPTATLPTPDVERLFHVLRGLAEEGVTLMYISHRLEEVYDLCHRVTVLRDGQKAASFSVSETSPSDVIAAMVGARLASSLERAAMSGEETPRLGSGRREHIVLSVRHLSDESKLRDVGFDVFDGEVLGVVGLVGSGQSEVATALAGARKTSRGEVMLDGSPVRLRSPREAIRHGIGLLPEDRKTEGFVPDMSVAANITLASLQEFSRFGIRRGEAEVTVARGLAERLDMRIASVRQSMKSLSGGTQQKAIFGKWLTRSVRLLICNEPTRGVDVAAREEIYQLIRDFAARGNTVIIATSELSEAIMCDRVLVMARGRMVAEVDHEEIDPRGERILAQFA